MSEQKISTLLALSLLAAPIASPSYQPEIRAKNSIESISSRASARRMKHLLATAPQLQPMGTYVGELQEKWQFPSDHLPIGMTIHDINFASWNVLDSNYISWVTEKNSQGLSRSMIADEHVYIGESKLTIRDQNVASLILEMISHPTHPRGILSLQECNDAFIAELRSRIPSHFEIVSCHGEAILIDKQQFEILESKEIKGLFTGEHFRTFQEVKIRNLKTGESIRLINAHLPGDPTKPARYEFATYIANTFDPNMTTIAMGDMNFDELEMSDAFKQAFPNNPLFSTYSPYCTNISPFAFNSKAIDHFFVYSPDKASVTLSTPDQIMPGLDAIVSLLQ